MLRLRDVKPGKFKLLVVSRQIGGMGTTPTVKLEKTEQTRGDIEKFIDKNVEQLANVDGFKDIQQEVGETLLRGAEGTYLWVSLVMVEIKKQKTCTEILAASKSVPPGLDKYYGHMLKQIDLAHQGNLYQILRWVTVAIRPLTLQELSTVIKAPPSSSIPPEQVVRDAVTSAEGLLKIQGDEVTLIHTTVKEFFVSATTSNDANSEGVVVGLDELHYEVADFCYRNILGSMLSRSEVRVSQLSDNEEPKLLKYAIKHWMYHVKASDWAEKNYEPDSEFFRKDSKLRKNWWTAYLEDSQNDDPKNFNVASLLHLSAYFGIAAWIKRASEGKAWIKKKGTTLMEMDQYYRTPLHIAVEQGHSPVVSLLLEQGSDIEYREASLFATPLHIAARNGYENICKILLDHKARINARNRFQSTPLTEAARGGHSDVVKLLVDHDADINGSIDKTHRSLKSQLENLPGYTKRALGKIDGLSYAERSTPVIEAARQNHTTIIRYLVRNGADIEATTQQGSSALQVAAFSGQMKAVEVLVDLGADIEKKDDAKCSALYMASWQNHADVVKWLLDKDADSDSFISTGFTPLHIAAKNGYLEPIQLLLEAGAKIERRDEKGFTALAYAAEWGRVTAIKLLIDHGTKIDVQTDAGNTALMLAIQENVTDELVEMVQLLLKHGANVNHQNRVGSTPLMKAAGLSNKDAATIVQHLLEEDPDLGLRDNEERTALMRAFRGGSNKTRELLLGKDVNLETKDRLGDTALTIAAGYADPSAVKLLLECGVDIEVRDRFGFTPLIKAAKCGFDESVKLLLDKGAEVATVDNDNKAAMDHAAKRMREKIMKYLESSGASRRTLKLTNRATAAMSNVMFWEAEDLQYWERRWEQSALKKLGKNSSVIKASDVGSSDDMTKVMSIEDEGGTQMSRGEQGMGDQQSVQDDASSDITLTVPMAANLNDGSVYSSAERADDQEIQACKETDDGTHYR